VNRRLLWFLRAQVGEDYVRIQNYPHHSTRVAALVAPSLGVESIRDALVDFLAHLYRNVLNFLIRQGARLAVGFKRFPIQFGDETAPTIAISRPLQVGIGFRRNHHGDGSPIDIDHDIFAGLHDMRDGAPQRFIIGSIFALGPNESDIRHDRYP
jgi:hypothetical protein